MRSPDSVSRSRRARRFAREFASFLSILRSLDSCEADAAERWRLTLKVAELEARAARTKTPVDRTRS